jgi:PPK2 family polyphosphate:nucleotide phosphotransferase
VAKSASRQMPVSELLRVPTGDADLCSYDTRSTPGFSGSKTAGKAALAEVGSRLSDLQEKLYASGVKGDRRSVLLVLQGMDSSGKGGTVRHVIGQVDPQGCAVTAFKAPTAEELAHDFLWRVRRQLPGPGILGVFDRSHYEDVLIVRVHELVPRATWARRYSTINRFEAGLAERGIQMIKVFLHISKEEQRQRLIARLDDPTKHWKFNPHDIDERRRWRDYQEAYAVAIEKTNTEHAPWLVVPSDRKWYRNLAVGNVLRETLRRMDPSWPGPAFDVEEQRLRLVDEAPLG